MSLSPMNIGSQQVVAGGTIERSKESWTRGGSDPTMPADAHWKTPEYTVPGNAKRWNSSNFPSINWTVNAREQAFAWIHRNLLPQKI